MTKSVLCYGDSNTWGYDAATEGRYPLEERWVNVLARELGSEFQVIAEGLNGRTTVWPDPVEGEHKNGKSYLFPCLESHYPLDLVVLMLGTNDLKNRFGLSAWDIASGVETLVQVIQGSGFGPGGGAPRVLVIAPPPTRVRGTIFESMFAGSDERSPGLAREYERVAQEYGCAFLDAGKVIVSSSRDGIHFDPAELPKFGRAVAGQVRELFAVKA